MPATEEVASGLEKAAPVVASNMEDAAQAVRSFNPKTIAFVLGGVAIGVGVGFFVGQRWRREKIKAEVFAESELELTKIREYYASTRPEKPALEDVVEELGYNAPPVEEERPLPPPVPVSPSRTMKVERPSQRTGRTEVAEKDKFEGWSYPFELSQRNWKKPHIIHQDEFATGETEYAQTTYTYYAGDNVLVDTDNTVLHNRENLIGTEALRRFGHGSDDLNIVYVRNTELELEIEIVRDLGRYEVEVQGLEEDDEDSPDIS